VISENVLAGCPFGWSEESRGAYHHEIARFIVVRGYSEPKGRREWLRDLPPMPEQRGNLRSGTGGHLLMNPDRHPLGRLVAPAPSGQRRMPLRSQLWILPLIRNVAALAFGRSILG
jgi:hypothetical protein